ncbi:MULTISPECIES: cytidylyltransferase family protein [Metallosphaera]|uniref:cytidylyltransferase family protein n=1 Tax=Metallosphaera TaxID=41980 RepID=UPI001F0666FC|nr:cytidylyltransferase family protein [Metallosphaera sedula]MCH1771349.1 cytidylyltransferase family protein [Metallosphaera sedula]MCP6729739.1 cytidylyltransferase family protein [Metallosphaera sedula]
MEMPELRDRVIKYINGMEETLKQVKGDERVISLAKQYVNDAKYYLERGDLETALVDVVYAEGLVDALKIVEGEGSKKVFVGGTFDIIHPGHIEFLRRAASLGRVYVAVSRDKNAEKVKGRKPVNDENQRLEVVKSIRYVYEAFLGDENDFLKSVERVKPDIIFLGPDQKVDEKALKEELARRGILVEVVRLEHRINTWGHSSTSAIIKEITERYCNHA